LGAFLGLEFSFLLLLGVMRPQVGEYILVGNPHILATGPGKLGSRGFNRMWGFVSQNRGFFEK